jgi:hypothetical protein
VLLTAAQQQAVARRADFFFDLYMGLGRGDSSIYTGDGVDDLDQVASVIAAGTNIGAKFTVDVGSQYSDYRRFDVEDLSAIRAQYIALRPDECVSPPSR